MTHSNGSYERKSRGRKLADEMGRADSYFHLMTIKHSISKIEWASNDYIIQLSLTNQLNCVPFPVELSCQ